MIERTIQIEGFPFINFREFSIIQGVNQHMTAKMKGNISEEFADELREKHLQNQPIMIRAKGDDGQQRDWLGGIIEDFRLSVQGGVHTLSLKIISHSKKSDIHRHIRTFQDSALTYRDVADILGKQSDDLHILITDECRDKPIDTFLVQHEETDWEFAMRLASRAHTFLFPCARLDYNGIYMGLSDSVDKHVLDTTEYIMRRDMDEFHRSQTDETLTCLEQCAVSYIVKSREIYSLRHCIVLNGMELYVYAIQSELVGAELIHTYTLKVWHGFRTKATFNRELVGVTLTGNVHNVQKDMVQINVQNDIEQREYRWFPYSTIYSSPDDTGWYFMPEIGDQVRLTFPNEHELDSYVVSSVHMGDRANPDNKSIRTKYQKEIVFSPDSIYISNGAGSHIELHDENGITIHSDNQIRIESGGNIDIQGQGEVSILGDAGASIQQGENRIDVDDTVDITAGRLRMR